MSRLLGYFARGCLAVVPLAATLYILYIIVTGLDGLLGVTFPGLGILVALGLITGVGFLVSNVVGRKVYELFEAGMAHVPLVKLLYSSLRDLVSAFVGENRRFGRAVSVQLSPGSETYLLGFMSREHLEALSLPDHVAVYVPQAYNIGGQVLIVPRDQVTHLGVPAADLLRFLLSGGASGLGVRNTAPMPPVAPVQE